MEDKRIIELFYERSESAISELQEKYGAYIRTVIFNILRNDDDTNECINDLLLKLWDIIPPEKPENLKVFCATLSRNIALNRLRFDEASKRNRRADIYISEFAELIPSMELSTDDRALLRSAINDFLSKLSKQSRIIFVQRYYYNCSIKEISEKTGLSENNVKVTLSRTREIFKEYMQKEGFINE